MANPVQISPEFVRVYETLASAAAWLSISDIAEATDVSKRTVRLHALTLATKGIAERAQVFPGYRYRIARTPASDGAKLLKQIKAASAVYGERQ